MVYFIVAKSRPIDPGCTHATTAHKSYAMYHQESHLCGFCGRQIWLRKELLYATSLVTHGLHVHVKPKEFRIYCYEPVVIICAKNCVICFIDEPR